MTKHTNTVTLQSGAQVLIPLSKLKKSPRNVRQVPHTQEAIDGLAASIAAKGILQNLVVEPELNTEGAETGFYLVTIGEGRRLAQLQRVKRKEIKKDTPLPCVIDTANDAEEISLDENVNREAMHPADQFEAFKKLADKGHGAEDIAARFGIKAHTVKQRLRLGAVSPRLMQLYRDDALKLEQLMAFALTENQSRQEAVYERLKDGYNINAYTIRRLLTENHADADDYRIKFVGVEAYKAEGGHIERDLFTEDNGGHFRDVLLLDRLALEKLEGIANDIQAREGWKWVQHCLEYPHGHGMRRVYPDAVDFTPEDQASYDAACQELDEIAATYGDEDNLTDEARSRYEGLNTQIQTLEDKTKVYDADDINRGGVLVLIDNEGVLRIERGFIRPEDEAPKAEPETETAAHVTDAEEGDDHEQADDEEADEEEEPANAVKKPLPDSLIADLTAHRTLGLQLALGERPDMALIVATQAMAINVFYRSSTAHCVELRLNSVSLSNLASGIDDTPAAVALRTRHDAWAEQLPKDTKDLWDYLSALDLASLNLLFAHCVAYGVNAVKSPFGGQSDRLQTVEKLATALSLNMADHWKATNASYFARITKAHIFDTVTEAVGIEAAQRIEGLKKPVMADHAETLLAGTGWLPAILRTTPAIVQDQTATVEADYQAAAE